MVAPLLALAAPQLIDFAVSAGKTLIDRLWPDKEKQAAERQAAELELYKLAREKEMSENAQNVQLAVAQLEVNKVEAASDSLFKSGWRPATGWMCVFGFSYQIMIRPTANWVMINYLDWTVPLESLDLQTLGTLLFGMLGLGAYRTYEKVVDKKVNGGNHG
jgi:hypothetical protein